MFATGAPLFLGTLLNDWAYSKTFLIQWGNFAFWLNAGALVIVGIALAWSIISAIFRTSTGGRRRWIYVLVVAAVFVLGFINNPDRRVQPFKEHMVSKTVRPDYSLGSHTAPLGLAFSTATMGARFAEGAFVGMHGSWNREVPVGYKVVFVPFRGGRPAGKPIDVVTGFQADGKTFGRPVGVTADPRGALLVADDLSNTLWRVTPTRQPGARQAAPAQ